MPRIVYSILIGTLWCFLSSSKGEKKVSMIGKEVPAFTLPDCKGSKLSINNYKNAKGFIIVFTCNHCPFAKLYTKRFNELNKKYKPLGVPILAINPMDSLVYEDENARGMKVWAASQHFNFPYLQDGSQTVARSFYALHTPQAFVIWKENNKWIVRYSGAIDNNGQHPEIAKPYVANAVEALLNHKAPAEPENLSFGCAIHYRQ